MGRTLKRLGAWDRLVKLAKNCARVFLSRNSQCYRNVWKLTVLYPSGIRTQVKLLNLPLTPSPPMYVVPPMYEGKGIESAQVYVHTFKRYKYIAYVARPPWPNPRTVKLFSIERLSYCGMGTLLNTTRISNRIVLTFRKLGWPNVE